MFTAGSKGDRPRREFEQIAAQLQVLEGQRCRAEMRGGDEYFVNHRVRILVEAKRIEGSCRIGIEQRLTQSIVVDHPAAELYPAIFVITKSCLPVPRLKI